MGAQTRSMLGVLLVLVVPQLSFARNSRESYSPMEIRLPAGLFLADYIGLTYRTLEACASDCDSVNQCVRLVENLGTVRQRFACLSLCKRDSDCPSGQLCVCSNSACAFGETDWLDRMSGMCVPLAPMRRSDVALRIRRSALWEKLIPVPRKHELPKGCPGDKQFFRHGVCCKECAGDDVCGKGMICVEGRCVLSCENRWVCPQGYSCDSCSRPAGRLCCVRYEETEPVPFRDVEGGGEQLLR